MNHKTNCHKADTVL